LLGPEKDALPGLDQPPAARAPPVAVEVPDVHGQIRRPAGAVLKMVGYAVDLTGGRRRQRERLLILFLDGMLPRQ
jgi:hypothetical protein